MARLPFTQGIRKAGIEIRGQHGSDKAPHDEVGKNLVPAADAIHRAHQVEQDAFAVLRGNEKVLNDRRKVLGQTVGAGKEPVEPVQPGFVLGGLHPLRRSGVLQFTLRIDQASNPLDGFGGRRDARTERRPRPKDDQRRGFVGGPQKRREYR
jgi:hypothetical protein